MASSFALGLLAASARAADLQIGPLSHPTLPLQAAALFHYDSGAGALVVTLTNTAQTDVLFNYEILTAMFFDISGASLLNLSRTSATDLHPLSLLFGPGSTGLSFDPPPDGVGGEWNYSEGLTNAPLGQRYSLNSSGLGLSGSANGRFPGANLDGQSAVDGLNYGIDTATDNSTTFQNPGVHGDMGPLSRNEIQFVLSGLPAGFDPMARIANVQFQYGTALCDAAGTSPDRCVPDTPEPATLSLLLLPLLLFRRRFA